MILLQQQLARDASGNLNLSPRAKPRKALRCFTSGGFCVYTYKVQGKKIMSKGFNANDLLRFQVRRNVTGLYKSFLILIEDLERDQEIQFSKLKESMPEYKALLEQAEFLDSGKSNYIRKKILDAGNGAIREIISELENYDVNFSENGYNQ